VRGALFSVTHLRSSVVRKFCSSRHEVYRRIAVEGGGLPIERSPLDFSRSRKLRRYMPGIPFIELGWELKKRKKLEPTSTALPAASASSISFDEVMPLLPSGVGQSCG